MIGQIGVRKTRELLRAPSSRRRCGPDPRITIPASGMIGRMNRPDTSPHSITKPDVQIFLANRAASTQEARPDYHVRESRGTRKGVQDRRGLNGKAKTLNARPSCSRAAGSPECVGNTPARRGRAPCSPACNVTSSSRRARAVSPRQNWPLPIPSASPSSAFSLPCSRVCCRLFPSRPRRFTKPTGDMPDGPDLRKINLPDTCQG